MESTYPKPNHAHSQHRQEIQPRNLQPLPDGWSLAHVHDDDRSAGVVISALLGGVTVMRCNSLGLGLALTALEEVHLGIAVLEGAMCCRVR